MDKPLEITFRNMDRIDTIVAAIEDKCRKLERFYSHITHIHVAIEAPHKHHLHGRHYRIDIEITVPGKRLVANHTSDKRLRHESLIPAINDAFHAVRRQLEDYARKQRGSIKHHEGPEQARISSVQEG